VQVELFDKLRFETKKCISCWLI